MDFIIYKKSLWSIFAFIITRFSVVFTKKLKYGIELKFEVDGGDLMKIFAIVTHCLAGLITGACGVRSSNDKG